MTSLTWRSGIRRDSTADRAEPVWRMPARSSQRIVEATPKWPRSTVWFEAVSQTSQPVHRIASASAGGALKIGYVEGAPAPIGCST